MVKTLLFARILHLAFPGTVTDTGTNSGADSETSTGSNILVLILVLVLVLELVLVQEQEQEQSVHCVPTGFNLDFRNLLENQNFNCHEFWNPMLVKSLQVRCMLQICW